MKKRTKIVIIVVLILLLILLDQCIKLYFENNKQSINIIDGVLKFTYSQNTGGAFSIGDESLLSIIITNIIILGIIIKFMITNFERMNCQTKICISLILAGGISNFFDRIFRGYVIDFIDFTPCINFPIFNLADIYIVLCWIFFVLLTIRYTIKDKKG